MFDDLDPQQNNTGGGNQGFGQAPQTSPTPQAVSFNAPQTPNPAPVKNPSELEDIFSETDNSGQSAVIRGNLNKEKPEVFKTKPSDNQNTPEVDHKSRKIGKIIMMAVSFFALAGVAYGGYWGYINMLTGEEVEETAEEIPAENIVVEEQPTSVEKNPEPIVEEVSNEPIEVIEEQPIVVENNNQNEQPAETPSFENIIDTDQDGLTDEEEVALGTDISNSDTDGDNLSDRQEVKVYKTNPLNPDTDGDTFLDGDEIKAGYNPNGPGKLLNIEEYLNNKNDQ